MGKSRRIPCNVFFVIFTVGSLGNLSVSALAAADEPFPAESAEKVGIRADAVELLGEQVEKLVAAESIVGGELCIIKSRKTIFRKAYGWADREAKRPLETSAIFCVRSMTKPICGTAIQILIDDGKLRLDQLVADILPAFDQPKLRTITIEHLLTHSSGLPMTAIQAALSEYDSIDDVATEAARVGLDFRPGSSFQYSDAGSDTLGAIIAAITGKTVEQFLQSRILDPLEMTDTITLLQGDLRKKRIPSAYSGGAGNWNFHWKVSQDPIFPIFLTSQSLYCTTIDYARFIALWMDNGKVDGQQLISQEAVARGLTPAWPIREYPTGFNNLELSYGQQWMIYHEKDSAEPVVFGHNGSDGTHVWAWPKQDLIVLFFTQSRGTMAGIELESPIHRLLIQQDIDGFRRESLALEAARQSFEPFEGVYWDEDVSDAFYVARVENDKLMVERPGKFRAQAKPTKEEGKFVAGSSLKLEFERTETPAPAMLMTTSTRTERQIRHQLQKGIPSANDVAAKVAEAHGMPSLKEGGVIKLAGTIRTGLLGFKGSIQQWIGHRGSRTEIKLGTRNILVVTNGEEVVATGASGSLERPDGIARKQEVLGHPAIEYGGWLQGYAEVEVLKEDVSEKTLLIRAESDGVPTVAFVVDTETHLVKGAKRVQFAPGLGFIGIETKYSVYREIAGVTLPLKIESQYANRLMGKVVIEFKEFESGIDEADLFVLPK